MVLKITNEAVAIGFSKLLDALYPAYKHCATKERGCRNWTVRVYCRGTGALLMTRAKV